MTMETLMIDTEKLEQNYLLVRKSQVGIELMA